MTINERLEQIQRRWNCDLKYRQPADPAAAELHEFVADLLDEIEEHEWDHEHVCEPDVLTVEGDLSWEEHDEELNRLEQQHAERMGEFAPAVEDLHRQAHGAGSLYMCTAEPCRSLYRLLPNARGQVLGPVT